jgi:phage head maturation protease
MIDQQLAEKVAAGTASLEEMKLLGADAVMRIKTSGDVPQFRCKAVEPISVNEERRTISYLVSDETPDRMGDVIRVKGWDLSNYKKNPVILWAHDGKNVPPIGRAHNVRRRFGPNRLTADIEFAPAEAHEFAETIYQLAARGFIKATSVGFMPKGVESIDEEARQALGVGPYGQVFSESELMEISIVSVPANPSALEVGVKSLMSEGMLEDRLATRFFEVYPRSAEEAQRKIREACRSFVDFGAIEKSPACRQSDESESECVSRKVPELVDEGMEQDQAVAAAYSMCGESCSEKEKQMETKNVEKLREAVSYLSSGLMMVKEALEEYTDDEYSDEEDMGKPMDEDKPYKAWTAMSALLENQSEHTRATRQLVDALTDLTVKLREEPRDDSKGDCGCKQSDAQESEVVELTEADIEEVIKNVSRGFAERVIRRGNQ